MAKKHERDHLYQKAGESTWYVRLVVPADVRPAFGNRRTLTKTTGTSNKTEAMIARLPILALWKQQIQEARDWKAEAGDEWRQQAADAGERLNASRALAAQKIYSSSLDESPPSDLSWLEALPEMAQELISAGRADLANRLAHYAERLVGGIGRMSPEEGMSLSNELAVLISDVNIAAISDEYELTKEEQVLAQTITRNPKSYKPRSPITKAMLDSWAAHLESQIPTPKTRDRYKQSVQRFSDYLSKEGQPLTFDTVHSFLGTLTASRSTRANYLLAGRTFWKWANKYQPAFRDQYGKAPCPFDGHELPKTGEAAGRKRAAYTKSEIERLYRKVAESDVLLAHLIQFGAYTGARLEEIGRIRPEDTIFDEGGEPIGFKVLQSKTEAGIRDVPLHTALVPLFKELSSNADANGGYLFPGGKNKYSNRLDYLSKRFGRLKTAEGFGKDHTFHSLRHSFTTLLHQLGVSIEILPYITGHETGSFTLSQYSKGPSLAQKSEAIQKLTFSFY